MGTSRATRFVQVVAVVALLPITVGLSGGTASGGSTSFPGTGTGAVPDGGPGCGAPAATSLDIAFAVSGVPAFDDISVDMTFFPDHNWMGDLSATLIGPDATEVSLFGNVGTSNTSSCGESSNMGGTYTFSDTSTGDLWVAADFPFSIVAPGSYFPTAPGNPAVAGPAPYASMTAPFTGTSADGTWILRLTDSGEGDTTGVTAATLTFNTDPSPPDVASSHDFDGDNKDDYSITRDGTPAPTAASTRRSLQEQTENPGFQPGALATASRNHGTDLDWYISNSGDGTARVQGFGQPFTDFTVPADYDGDGIDDLAVWRGTAPTGPGGGMFIWYGSSDNTVHEVDFGVQGDNPTVVGDYDGDGTADPAVYRCPPFPFGQCHFYYKGSAGGGGITQVAWGNNVASVVRPYPGDFDGDGKFDFAIHQDGRYTVLRSSDSGVEYIKWGNSTDAVLAPGDYDGDGRTDFANIRVNGSTVEWWILHRAGTTQILPWGALIPGFAEFAAQGDFDGDGKTDVSIWRRDNTGSDSFFYTLRSSDSTLQTFQWGSPGDSPVPGWNRN